jgi:hypothetical protein
MNLNYPHRFSSNRLRTAHSGNLRRTACHHAPPGGTGLHAQPGAGAHGRRAAHLPPAWCADAATEPQRRSLVFAQIGPPRDGRDGVLPGLRQRQQSGLRHSAANGRTCRRCSPVQIANQPPCRRCDLKRNRQPGSQQPPTQRNQPVLWPTAVPCLAYRLPQCKRLGPPRPASRNGRNHNSAFCTKPALP